MNNDASDRKRTVSGFRSWAGEAWFVLVLVATFVLCAAIFLRIWHVHGRPEELIDEVAKAALQIGVVSVAAILLKMLVDRRDRLLVRRESQEGEVKDLLSRVTAGYNAVKRARREMRALGRRYPGDSMDLVVAAYDKCMVDLNSAQLELEAVISQIKDAPHALFPEDGPRHQLKRMEKYLGKFIREYERNRPKVGNAETVSATNLLWLRDLIGPANVKRLHGVERPSYFKACFVEHYKTAMTKMRAELRVLAGREKRSSFVDPAVKAEARRK